MSAIKMEFVKSSMLNAIGHKDKTMAVQFKSGEVWHYEGVSKAVFDKVKGAKSPGQEFLATVRDNYPAAQQPAQ